MKKVIISLAAAAFLPLAGAAELKFHLSADSMKPGPGVKSISSSVRLVPGKFGKGMLFERQVNR